MEPQEQAEDRLSDGEPIEAAGYGLARPITFPIIFGSVPTRFLIGFCPPPAAAGGGGGNLSETVEDLTLEGTVSLRNALRYT